MGRNLNSNRLIEIIEKKSEELEIPRIEIGIATSKINKLYK